MGDPSPRSTDASWIQQWDQCMSDDVVAMREWLDALRQDPQAAKDQEVIARSLNQRIAQSMRRVEKRQKQISLNIQIDLRHKDHQKLPHQHSFC